MGRLVGRDEAVRLAADLRRDGRRLVLTNGCFDLLHVGHLRYLTAAKAMGDVLLVGVNDDARVRALKGPGRPFNAAAERAELVAGLSPVDFVFIFGDDTAGALIEELRPHVYAKGGDYLPSTLPEAATVAACGAELVFLPLVPGQSTTRLAERVAQGHRRFGGERSSCSCRPNNRRDDR